MGKTTNMIRHTIKAILLGLGAFGASGCQGLGGRNHANSNTDPCGAPEQHQERKGFLARHFGRHNHDNHSPGATAAMKRNAPNVPLNPGETLVSYGETTMPVVEAAGPSLCPSPIPSAPCASAPSMAQPPLAPVPSTVAPPPPALPGQPRPEPQAQPVPARPTARTLPSVN